MMKRLILLALLALFLRPAVGLCALVQAVGSDCGHVATCNITIASTSAHSTLIVYVAIGAGTITNVVAGSSTITTADTTVTPAGNGPMAIYSIPDVAAGITTVTAHLSTTEWSAIGVAEESGLVTGGGSNKDQATSLNQSGGLTTWNSGNVTTTQASEIAYGYGYIGGYQAGGYAFVPDTGWSALTGTGITSGQVFETTFGITFYMVRRVLSSTGSYAASGTGPNDTYSAGIATYKVASGGSCTHSGYTSAGAIAIPNGSSGSYWGKSGAFVTPDCSTVNYWSPTAGNFVVN